VAEECAFCPKTAKLTGEHVFSDWMNLVLPGRKLWRRYQQDGSHREWQWPGLHLKAKVVCGDCNSGWMSRLENRYAKPAMTDLILGKQSIPIPQSRANSIALFAFKTAVIFEHMSKHRHARFFSREARYRFKSTLEIPNNVRMWMIGFSSRASGACFSFYYEIDEHGRIELYVCNFRAGHFAFQVVVDRKPTFLTIIPHARFEHLAVPFWPRIHDGFVWPPQVMLKSASEFRDFGTRWNNVHVLRFTGD
jgi:hypothetical protein